MTQPVFVVDAFTSEPFKGNSAAVVPLQHPRPASWMQAVAAEMNLSETAFVDVSGGSSAGDAPRPLRWFTPLTEVDLCGHATLATAHVLGGQQRFSTRSGTLTCTPSDDGWITMDFPADPPVELADDSGVRQALPGLTITGAAVGSGDVLVAVSSAQEVLTAAPDMSKVAQLPHRGLLLTAESDDGEADFVSRCFFPALGVPEDPVTGSAHCTLGPWWADRVGRTDPVGRQVSRRGGVVRLSVQGNRVLLSGQAVTVLEGALV